MLVPWTVLLGRLYGPQGLRNLYDCSYALVHDTAACSSRLWSRRCPNSMAGRCVDTNDTRAVGNLRWVCFTQIADVDRGQAAITPSRWVRGRALASAKQSKALLRVKIPDLGRDVVVDSTHQTLGCEVAGLGSSTSRDSATGLTDVVMGKRVRNGPGRISKLDYYGRCRRPHA